MTILYTKAIKSLKVLSWVGICCAGATLFAALAPAHGRRVAEPAPRTPLEFTTIAASSEGVVDSLNNLDRQGWDVMQIIPVWKITNDAGATELQASSYRIFAKRPLKIEAK